jgi:large subunit ribosomal protein L3
MKFILGTKIEMTQIWKGENVIAVTKVQAGPCSIVQIKNKKNDGYEAAQIGFGEKKAKNIKKPQQGHLEKVKLNLRYLKEFSIEGEKNDLKIGDVITVGTFAEGDTIQVTGVSKGKGFQGGVKRHGFSGQNKSHGTKDQVRMPGSIGATDAQHVFKGKRMAGHMGDDRVTTKNLKIVEIDKINNILFISGAVPGARNGLVMISGEGALEVNEKLIMNNEKLDNQNTEEIKTEAVETPVVVEEVKVEEEKLSEPLINTESADNTEIKIEEIKIETPVVEEVKIEETKKEEGIV